MPPLVITEGEKKAIAGCVRGLPVIGVAGVWNWRQTLDTGEKLVLSALDQIAWKGRSVELVPDSDAWLEAKILKVLGGSMYPAKNWFRVERLSRWSGSLSVAGSR